MALETWLIKVKKTIAHGFDSVRSTPPVAKRPTIRKSNVAVLSFEIAAIMSKLLHLWQALSDRNVARLRGESIRLEGVRKIVSNDDAFLLGLACAELVDSLKSVAKSVARLSVKCEDSSLRCFDRSFDEFANSGRDPNGWLVVGTKEIESKIKKLDRFVATTAALHRELDELSVLENNLKRSLKNSDSAMKDHNKIVELHQKIVWRRQEIKYLKEKSLWCRSFDTVTSLLARFVFTVLARTKLVFGVTRGFPIALPRSLSSSSALVYPSENPNAYPFVSGPLTKNSPSRLDGFFELNSKILKPPSTTLGAAALALHYSNLVIVMEKMIRSPQLVGVDARDDLYSMLPNSVRFALRARLKGVGFSASDPNLANEWREALLRILGWLSPLAHNMIKWQSERSFEQQNVVPKTNVLLLQTLYFANQEKAEAAITELLVGLNYIWRFEREMNAKAIFQCSNFNGFMNSRDSI